ncbi:DMT family transporter [Polycladomyces sp. WAk]|uniref:DMT family transporter n=1 Tax=Polycladomyces zharkentensis TaxID=2807616 RepID=A0ABS2WLH5_9BACL|nr:DMT family transporter [Polycladomyces sp. WAk]MBN2910384.1 DMT family transporter [Polycladomyces sp. WAk]
MTGLSVAMVPVLAFFILKTKPNLGAIIGVSLATVGLYLLAFINLSEINKGDILAFLNAIAFGLHIVYTDKYSNINELFQLVTIKFGTVALLSGICSFLFEDVSEVFNPSTILNPSVLTALLVCSLLATVLAYLAQTYFQRYTTPIQVALIFALEPVVAAISDYFWNDAVLTGRTILGCMLILIGMLLAEIDVVKLIKKTGTEKKVKSISEGS